jgi:N-acetylated-alpha-linked acidic dipeptidase
MKKVLFPEGWGDFPTLYDMWYNVSEGSISPLGSGSDYASFYQNGIACVSISTLFLPSIIVQATGALH